MHKPPIVKLGTQNFEGGWCLREGNNSTAYRTAQVFLTFTWISQVLTLKVAYPRRLTCAQASAQIQYINQLLNTESMFDKAQDLLKRGVQQQQESQHYLFRRIQRCSCTVNGM